MPFNAIVVRVLIASPSDTAAERQVLKDTLEEWNSLHAENHGVMVLPVMWERDATPEMGDRPQAIINRQLVDSADMLVGIFWTRLGTPTSEAESGTVEEVERCIKAGKPVLLYFSSQPVVPGSVDTEQLDSLLRFHEDLEKRGLINTFATDAELRHKVTTAVTRTIREKFAESLSTDLDSVVDDSSTAGPRAVVVARIDREREVRGFSKTGRPQYSTRERLVIENRGTAAAENLTFTSEVPEGARPPTIAKNEEPVRRLLPGAALDYPLLRAFGTSTQWDVVFRWNEADAQYEERQTMS